MLLGNYWILLGLLRHRESIEIDTLLRIHSAVPISKICHSAVSANRVAAAMHRLRRLRSHKWIFHLLLEIIVLVLVLGFENMAFQFSFSCRWRPASKYMFGYPSFCLQIWHGQTLAKNTSDDQQQATQHRLYRIAFLAFRCSSVYAHCQLFR